MHAREDGRRDRVALLPLPPGTPAVGLLVRALVGVLGVATGPAPVDIGRRVVVAVVVVAVRVVVVVRVAVLAAAVTALEVERVERLGDRDVGLVEAGAVVLDGCVVLTLVLLELPGVRELAHVLVGAPRRRHVVGRVRPADGGVRRLVEPVGAVVD